MARLSRFKVTEEDAWYHLYSRVAGVRDDYVLSNALVQRKLIDMIQHFSSAYYCQVASYSIMGSHYHLIAHFEAPREIDFAELQRRAAILYPSESSQRTITYWDESQWERFRERLFDVSEFMRSLQSAFARWYNKEFGRLGRFWADRYKSVYLETNNALLDCMLYVDLNPVRAGIVQRPEAYKGSSLYLREISKADWLVPLREILRCRSHKQALVEYRERLYYRGNVPTKEGQAAISDRVLAQEEAKGFTVRGMYLRRFGYFVDGVAIGTELFLREQLSQLRESGIYSRRSNPIVQLEGGHLTLREQRVT